MNRVLVGFVLATVAIVSVGIMASPTEAGPVVRFNLNYSVNDASGPINYFDVELYDTAAPITVANFLKYVNNHLYDNTIIHRNPQDFVVQGGGFTPTATGGSITSLDPIASYGKIQNEYSSTRSNVRGTLAMAKVGGDPNSATNQWFVNLGNNAANLDNQNGGFTVFGQVIGQGMKLIDAVNSLTKYNLSQTFGSTFDTVPLFNNGTSLVTITSAAVVAPTPTGSFSGFVYVDTNHNGIKDSADYAIADAKVTLVQNSTNTAVGTIYSSSDGSFQFNNLASGTFSIKMETPSSASSQNGGSARVILDKSGSTVSTGTAGTVQPNAYGNVVLGDGYTGLNFNFAQSAYPVTLVSARLLLNTSKLTPYTDSVPTPDPNPTPAGVLGTNPANGSLVNFGNVLVGSPSSKPLTVTNLGAQGSTLSGTLSGASGTFSPSGSSAFGPLGSGNDSSRTYTYKPTFRGANTQDVTVTSNGGNSTVTLSGKGVAPIQSVDTSAANAGKVRIGTTGTVSVTVKNTGDGNLSGLGESSNLKGNATQLASGKFIGDGGPISLTDKGTATDTKTFTYTYKPTSIGVDSMPITFQFSNGSADWANLAQTVNATLGGEGVGPIYFSDKSTDPTLDFSGPHATARSIGLTIMNVSPQNSGGNTALTDLTLLGAEITGQGSEFLSLNGFTAGTVLHDNSGPLNLEIAYNGLGAHAFEFNALLTIRTDEGAALGGNGNTYTYNIKGSLAPEPGSMVLLAMAGLFVGGVAWRRRAAKKV